jgi:hypothetical protein
MSMLAIAFPAEAAISVAQAFWGALRPMLGIGIFATALVLFRPLIIGLLRAALLVLSPRKSLNERRASNAAHGARKLNRLAREMEATQPNLAAELRWVAARGE